MLSLSTPPSRSFVPPEVSWGDTEAAIEVALRHASGHPAGEAGGFLLYGARGVNAHVIEPGLHLETKAPRPPCRQLRIDLTSSG